MVKLAVLVSGSGTNLQAIIRAIQQKKLIAEIVAVVSDRKNAYALQRAANAGISHYYIPKGETQMQQMNEKLLGVDYIVLAGFLSILSDEFCQQWANRMINIHPSLLPKYGGKGMYGMKVHEAVIANKEEETGATVHWVTAVIDGGNTIVQKSCAVTSEDTPKTVAEKVHEIEHEILITALKKITE